MLRRRQNSAGRFVDLLGNFGPVPADVNQQIHTVKFGVNYRFGYGKAPAPVVAK